MILRRRSKTGENRYLGYVEIGHWFAKRVRQDLKRRPELVANSIFFAYDTGALEVMAWCRDRQVKCVLNQMDPSRVEVTLVQAEESRWPGWAKSTTQVPEDYFYRREQEWALADIVVVNSDFSRQALLQQGVPAEKIEVIPLCYEPVESASPLERVHRNPDQPLRVLFLGQVILRKGIQYLVAAAKELQGENVRFDVVGPIGISREAIASAPANLTFHGRTDRALAADWYRRSDVFVIPTISDGFAITQLEAMAYGLPVVATPCCGEVVSDGVDGFIVPARDVAALVAVLRRYLEEPDLSRQQGEMALKKSKQFNLQRLAENLISLECALLHR